MLKIKTLLHETGEPYERDTYPTDETVRMPLAVECGYIILHNGAITAAAFRREHVEIVLATIRLAVSLVEAVLAELLAALSAEEMLSVPGLLQGSYTFLEEIFLLQPRICVTKYLKDSRKKV